MFVATLGRSAPPCRQLHRRVPPERFSGVTPAATGRPAYRPRAYPFRQWTGVRCQGRAGVDRRRRRKDHLHHAGQPVGERLHESFNARLRDELLDGEIFYTLHEAQIVIESWRRHYAVRPHASIGYRTPAPEVFVPALAIWPAAQPRPAPPAML